MDTTNVPPNAYIAVAQLYANARRWDLFTLAARRYLQFDPRNHRCWIELAFGHLMLDKTRDAMDAIRQAVNVGGEAARAVLREDKRFAPLYPSHEFQKLVQPSRQPFNLNPTQSGGNPAQRQLPGW
jgi:hypothetical protein